MLLAWAKRPFSGRQMAERVLSAGDRDEVDMIGHEAVGEDADAGIVQVLTYEAKVELTVSGGEEDPLAVGSTLGDVVGDSWCDGSCVARHAKK